jgi:hypothetical protein
MCGGWTQVHKTTVALPLCKTVYLLPTTMPRRPAEAYLRPNEGFDPPGKVIIVRCDIQAILVEG